MIKILVRKFVPNYTETSSIKVREAYGVLGGTLGIICNLFLFITKLIIGLLMNSIAIMSDAFNNMSDMCSSLVTVVSAKMSAKRPDKEHPYGHGRLEYVASLIVSIIIILVGYELFMGSIDKIVHPEPVAFNWVLFSILVVSILVKVWMFSYNRYIGKTIDSTVLKATAVDSMNDCFATSAVALSVIVDKYIELSIDGLMGVVVSIVILLAGINLARDIVGVLIGNPPPREFVEEITNFVMKPEQIIGVHDFIAHDYGPGRAIVSLHAEVPDDANIVEIHEVIDDLERRVMEKFGVLLVIHMDPISLNCEKTNEARATVESIIKDINKEFTIHDFRMVDGKSSVNLIFDLVVPIEMSAEERKKVTKLIEFKVKEIDNRYNIVINIDNGY